MSGNQRQAFRFRFPTNKQAGKLSMGSESIKVRLVDHSASGFSLLAPIHPLATSDSLLRLETTTASYEVRVVNLAKEKGEYRVGLAVEREITDSRKVKAVSSAWSAATPHPGCRMARGVAIALGAIVAAGGVLALVVALNLFSESDLLENKSLLTGETSPASLVEQRTIRPPSHSEGNTSSRVNPELQQRFDQLGAAAFMMPEVAKRLELTPQQIKTISRIVQKTAAAESQLASSGNDGKANPSRSRDLRRKSRDEARNVLNAEQAKQWDALIGD